MLPPWPELTDLTSLSLLSCVAAFSFLTVFLVEDFLSSPTSVFLKVPVFCGSFARGDDDDDC
jgi:hypothetical protein